ncbi:MAG: hypothetical protein NTW04_03195 [Elusimicrobia bacterium]|nr:hypothetical protein [Elusimicrobiota bacterium]
MRYTIIIQRGNFNKCNEKLRQSMLSPGFNENLQKLEKTLSEKTGDPIEKIQKLSMHEKFELAFNEGSVKKLPVNKPFVGVSEYGRDVEIVFKVIDDEMSIDAKFFNYVRTYNTEHITRYYGKVIYCLAEFSNYNGTHKGELLITVVNDMLVLAGMENEGSPIPSVAELNEGSPIPSVAELTDYSIITME